MKKFLSVVCLLIIASTILQPAFAQKKISFRLEIDPLIGGGFAGDNMKYIINSKGEIFKQKPELTGPGKMVLIKKVDPKEIHVLQHELKNADIWKMKTGDPQYSGKRWDITIDGRTKTLYFSNVPDKLKSAEQIVERMLQKPPKKQN